MKLKRMPLYMRAVAFMMTVVMLLTAVSAEVFAIDFPSKQDKLTFATISGLSYVSESNRGNYNEAFLLDAVSNGYQYEQIDGILDSAFESLKAKVENEDLKYLLVNGPLTYCGEYSNHAAVAEMLRKLESATGVNVIVSFAATDVNSASSSSFASGKREYVVPATASQLKTLYADLGFDIAANKYDTYDQNSAGLSYSVELEGGYRLVVIDASYFEFVNGYTQVNGKISTNLLKWIKTECTIARHAGQTLIGMCSWSIAGQDLFGLSEMIADADILANTLADAGMHYIFTSGTNKNDIATVISDNGNIIYDVQSAGIVSFPNTYRVSTFNGEKATFDIVDADEIKNIVSRDGTVYEKPYRETASLKIQYADFDMARYCATVIKNYVSSVLMPGIDKNGTLESFVSKQHGISLKDSINELIGGGLNILGIIIIFDASNIMNMLEDIFQQAQSEFLQDDDTLADICYNRFKTIFEAEVSPEECTAFLDTYGFGSADQGGTLEDLVLSFIVYSKCGNENIAEDEFMTDVIESFRTGTLVPFIFNMLGEVLIRDLLFEDILSKIEMKPQYLVFLDDTQDSLGYYLQIAFKAYLALHGEDSSVTGAVKSILKDGMFSEYGKTIDEVIDRFVDNTYSEKDLIVIGEQMAKILGSFVIDTDPAENGDYNISYDGSAGAVSYASKENFRLPSMITVTPGNDTSSEAYITWYTKATVTGTDIEIYNDKNSEFYGKHFIGVNGVTVATGAEEIERTSVILDLGWISFGSSTGTYNHHTMKISGLEPGCTYFLRVGDGAKNWWSETITVTTAADSENATFIHVSDTTGYTSFDFDVFENILDCADYLYPDTDFILHTGNYVDDNDSLNQWQTMLDGISENLLSSYIVPVAGNNDSKESVMNNFAVGSLLGKSEKTGVYYSFDYNLIHVTVLDSNCVKEDGTLTDEQLEWFIEDMQNTDAKWKFVAIHNPVYTNGGFSQDDNYSAYMTQIAGLMDQYDVDLVFTGSDGVYYRTDGMMKNEVSDTPKVAFPHQINDSVYYKTIPDPAGTVYSSLGSSGAIGSDSHEIYNVSKLFPASGQTVNPKYPMFTSVEILGDTLYLTTYTLNSNRATKVDSVSIKKGATLLGDVNFDGDVTAADARLILRAAAQIELLTKAQIQVADLNGDTKINASDARKTLRIAAKLE